jgi:iron(III) transport system ATP-binding protein
MTQLVVSGVTKAYGGRRVLDGVDLEVPEGSLTAILGPSGSGKTTLLRVIAGFEPVDSGIVRLGDRVVDGTGAYVPPENRRIGYVPQEGSLFPHLSVAANIGFGIPRRERREAVADLLDAVGMTGLGHRYPHQLSGGQQQRVALARALAVKPGIVLLDEPFGSLDAGLRATIRADVRRLLAAAGATAILVTHDQDEALSTADQVAVLRDGMIVQSAAPDELYNRPADPEVAQFIGEANLIDGILADGSVDTVLGPLQVRADARCGLDSGPVTVLVRPEQIEIGERNGRGGLAGRIVSLGYHGHDAVVHVDPEQQPGTGQPSTGQPGTGQPGTGQPGTGAIIVRTLGGCGLPTGSPVTLRARGPVPAWPRQARTG